MKHKNLVALTKLELGRLYPNIRVWDAATGVFKSFDGKAVIRVGVDGQADITGILPDGRRLEIEIKVGKDKQRESQKNFEKMINEKKGLYIIIDDKSSLASQLKKHLG